MKFGEWKRLDVTEEYFYQVRQRAETLKDLLAQSAGVDPALDRYRAGYIRACLDLIDTTEFEEPHGN